MKMRVSSIRLWFVAAIFIGGAALADENKQTKMSAPLSSKEHSCSFGAFVQESDPAGLNVRQTPSVTGKIIGKLPPVFTNPDLDGFKIRIEVNVLASKNGWFLIANAKDNPSLTGKPARRVFSGKGWVSGRKLTVKSQANKGYLQPTTQSPVAFAFIDQTSFDNDEMVHAAQLIACTGNWVLVDYSVGKLSADMVNQLNVQTTEHPVAEKGHVQGWVNQICAIQETSCDGTADQDK